MSKKLIVALGAVGMMMAAGSATALTFGTSNLNKTTSPVDCSLSINKTNPACAVPTTTYTSTG